MDMMVNNLLPSRLCDRKLRLAIGCINVSVGAHALGKDVAYNADERGWASCPPFLIINFIKAKAGERFLRCTSAID